MQDPPAENITGEMLEQHVFKHEINWGWVAIAIAAIYLVYTARGHLDIG